MKLSLLQSPLLRSLLVTSFLIPSVCFAADQKVEPEFSSVEERRLYQSVQQELDNIDERRNILLMREKELKTLEQGVDKKIAEVDKKLEELRDLKKKIDALLVQKSLEEQKKVKNLSKIYDKMDPGKAAFAISGMEEELATELLANMKVKAAAKILDNLNKQKATELSSSFSRIQLE